MRKVTVLLVLAVLLCSPAVHAQADPDELQALREQIEMLTKRLDELENQNTRQTEDATAASEQTVARAEEVDEKLGELDGQVASMSWAERIRWKGDFRYRYETIDEQGKDSRNRSRIRARTNLEADLTPNLEVGFGLATGGDDPVSSNQTIGGGGSSKDIKLDLAYFDWSGLTDTRVVGGKFKNYLIRPGGKGLRWDGDWRPEGLGAVWDNDRFYVQGLGTWLEGDSKNGTEFGWALQGGMKLKTGESSELSFGLGYTVFDIAGRTPLFGEPDDFYGNSFVAIPDPEDPGNTVRVFRYDYRNIEAFFDWKLKIGAFPVAFFANYTVNEEADENDTGYLFGAKFGSAKEKGSWDFTYFYEKLEADSTVGLVADSDFGGGGTDAKGHVLSGTYAFHKRWNFKATYFINEIKLSSDSPVDYDRLMLDLNFKFD
jgi:hypothetical protein